MQITHLENRSSSCALLPKGTIPCMWEGDQEKLVLSNTILFLLLLLKHVSTYLFVKSVPTQKIEKKNKKCQFVSRKASGFRLRLWRVLGYDYDQIFGSTDKKLTLFLQYDGNMLFGQSCKLSQEKGQKTWELELIDGLSLTRFLFKKKLFSFSVSIFEYFRKNGRDFLFNPAAGNGFFGLK